MKNQISVKRVNISKQVEENTGSMARAFLQTQGIEKYAEYEKKEDELKQSLKKLSSKYPELMSIYNTFCNIDKVQDKIMQAIDINARGIYSENRKMNGLWQIYDLKGNYANAVLKHAREEKGKKVTKIGLFDI